VSGDEGGKEERCGSGGGLCLWFCVGVFVVGVGGGGVGGWWGGGGGWGEWGGVAASSFPLFFFPFFSCVFELGGVPLFVCVVPFTNHPPMPPFPPPPPQVEVFDLKVIIPLLAEVSQVSRKELAAGGLTIENAHDKVCCLY